MKTDTQVNPDEHIKKLGNLIKDIKYAMVTTIDADKNLHSCPLTTQQVDFEGDLWFIVGKNSEVYANITADPRTNISYSSEKGTYVSVTGSAQVVEDRETLEKLWSPTLKIWFEKGIDDPNIGLIQVDVEKAEYWEVPTLAATRLVAFAKALVTGEKRSVSEHHKINLN